MVQASEVIYYIDKYSYLFFVILGLIGFLYALIGILDIYYGHLVDGFYFILIGICTLVLTSVIIYIQNYVIQLLYWIE